MNKDGVPRVVPAAMNTQARQTQLCAALQCALTSMAPRRSERERLLDLRLHGAAMEDLTDGLAALSTFLGQDLDLAERWQVQLPDGDDQHRRDFERFKAALLAQAGANAAIRERAPGVAKWVAVVAPALDVAPKTLANSLARGLRPARRDHRWLAWLVDSHGGELQSAAWFFHDRTGEAVTQTLARWHGARRWTVADALLLFSLTALWQRRRDSATARAHRGRAVPRRTMAKPAAALDDWLVSASQVAPLCRLIEGLHGGTDPQRASLLSAFVIEATLTQAHIVMHSATGRQRRRSGERLLHAAERELRAVGSELAPLLRWRIALMRAWRDKTALPLPEHDLADQSPYVQWTQWLWRSRQSAGASAVSSPSSAPPWSLLPQVRAKLARSAS